MKIALFGGRFDPVHNGHIAVAQEILRMKLADEVWFLPDSQHQWNPIIASAKDRLAILELAVSKQKNTRVDSTAIEIGGMTETITVIRQLRQKSDHEFIFVAGSDQLPTLHKWTHWQALQKELSFLIVARKGYPLSPMPENVTFLDDPNYLPLEDSATRIRKYRKEGKSILDLVPKKVEVYIAEKGLYQ